MTQQSPRTPRSPPSPISPLGAGMVARRLRIAPDAVVWLGTLLAGYDGLVSLHGDGREGPLVLVTTESRAAELDAVLEGLRDEVEFEVLAGA